MSDSTALGIGLSVCAVTVAQSSGGSGSTPVEAVGADVRHEDPPSGDELLAILRSGAFLDNGWQLLGSGRVATVATGVAQNTQPADEQEYPRVKASDLGRWIRDEMAEAAEQPPVKGIEGQAFLYGPPGDTSFDSRLAIKVYPRGVDVSLPPGGEAFETATEEVHVIPMGPKAPPAGEVVEGLVR